MPRWYAKKRCVCACPERWGDGAPLRVLREGASPTLRREDGTPGEHVCPSPRALARESKGKASFAASVTPAEKALILRAAKKAGARYPAGWARGVLVRAARDVLESK